MMTSIRQWRLNDDGYDAMMTSMMRWRLNDDSYDAMVASMRQRGEWMMMQMMAIYDAIAVECILFFTNGKIYVLLGIHNVTNILVKDRWFTDLYEHNASPKSWSKTVRNSVTLLPT